MPDRDIKRDNQGELMAAAQRGDSRAYTELLRGLVPRIRRMVRNQRGFVGESDIEDLVQEVLLSVHQARASYDPSRPFAPWLGAIVRHRLADGARRHARTVAREVAFDETQVTSTGQGTNNEGTDSDAATLRRAVRALPDGQRKAIELLKLRGLSLEEASAVTGSSKSALKVATHRAMTALKGKLGEHEED